MRLFVYYDDIARLAYGFPEYIIYDNVQAYKHMHGFLFIALANGTLHSINANYVSHVSQM